MAESSLEKCSYAPYSDDEPTVPARYQTRITPRGGKRRKTTLAKMDKRFSLEMQERQSQLQPSEEKYKLPTEDSSDSSADENYEVDSITSSIPESLTWRGRMQIALHSPWIHILIVVLVVADALIVIFELLLDVGAFGNLQCEGETLYNQKVFCHYAEHEECGPPAKLILDKLDIRNSAGSGKGDDELCTCKFRGGQRVCDDKGGSMGVNPALVLHVASLLILTVFVIEILLKLVAFRLKYFTHKFEVFDGIIVCLSYILDIASLQEEEAFEAASLVIILRLWRVVRIVNGAVLSAKSRSDQQLSEARLKARKIVHAFHKAQDRMDILEEQNRKLKKEVALSKAVRVPRGNYPTASETQPLIREKANEGQETRMVAHKEEPPEEKMIPVPDILISEPDGSDI